MSRPTERSPAYQWYPKDYQSDADVIAMTLEQEGAYRRLLDACWLECGLPTAPERLWRLAKCRNRQQFDRLWPAIKGKFFERRGRLYNRRLERERQKQQAHREKRQHAARVRWDAHASGDDAHALGAEFSTGGSRSTPRQKRGSVGTRSETDDGRTGQPTSARRRKSLTRGQLDAPPADAPAVQMQSTGDAKQCLSSSSSFAFADCSQKRTARARGSTSSVARMRAKLIRQQVRKLLKRQAWDYPGGQADLKEAIKERCAQSHIAYDGATVTAALEAELRWQEQRNR